MVEKGEIFHQSTLSGTLCKESTKSRQKSVTNQNGRKIGVFNQSIHSNLHSLQRLKN